MYDLPFEKFLGREGCYRYFFKTELHIYTYIDVPISMQNCGFKAIDKTRQTAHLLDFCRFIKIFFTVMKIKRKRRKWCWCSSGRWSFMTFFLVVWWIWSCSCALFCQTGLHFFQPGLHFFHSCGRWSNYGSLLHKYYHNKNIIYQNVQMVRL